MRNQFGRILIYSLFAILLFYTCLTLYFKVANTDYRLSIRPPSIFFSLLAMGYLLLLSLKKNFNFWPILKVITIGLYILVFYLTLLGCQRSMVCMFFFMPITALVIMQVSLKNSIIAITITFLLCFLIIPYISKRFNLGSEKVLTEDDAQTLKYLSYIIVTISFYLTFLTLYYYNELTKIANSAVKEKPFNSEQQSVDDSTLMLLYLKIQEYIENNKPYTHPDFTINMLSKKVKSNPSYVSRAINQEGGKNFSDFIQEYRINQVKEEFIKKHGHVIIKEVYERAGFRQQATFNRNFKKFVGKTPSQYCFDLQKDYFLS